MLKIILHADQITICLVWRIKTFGMDTASILVAGSGV